MIFAHGSIDLKHRIANRLGLLRGFNARATSVQRWFEIWIRDLDSGSIGAAIWPADLLIPVHKATTIGGCRNLCLARRGGGLDAAADLVVQLGNFRRRHRLGRVDCEALLVVLQGLLQVTRLLA
jgi:hypothetical protein